MEKYTKTDQEYVDAYDRHTVEILKELEKNSKTPVYYEPIVNSKDIFVDSRELIPHCHTLFFDMAVKRAQNKQQIILETKLADQRKDKLLSNTPVPRNITCNTCESEMQHETHLFKEEKTLLFVFSCPNKHIPKKAIYPDGKREWVFPKRDCKKCGGSLETKKVEKDKKLIFTDTCIRCGDVSVVELEFPEPELPINEDDRKKYCDSWKNEKTLKQSLEQMASLVDLIKKIKKEKNEKEFWEVDNIEKVKVPKLEDRLIQLSEKLEYIKFKFDSHSNEKFLSIVFSVQDATDRNEKESVKTLTKAIKADLLHTNWRLYTAGIDYRLGLLTGKLRAYVDDEGLLKIAKEIYEAKKSK